jgi:hypothetical protein
MKVSKELAEILQEASNEVDTWPRWQRSLDPQGSRRGSSEEAPESEGSAQDASDTKEPAA